MPGERQISEAPRKSLPPFENLLAESVRAHGHLCPGQVLGVRMAIRGLGEIGISDPKGRERRDLIVFVEIDRCATDAIQSVTGCSLGKRTLKYLDYGKMAATFVNLVTGNASRVSAREDSKEKAGEYFPGAEDRHAAQVQAYKIMEDRELFDVTPVRIGLRPEDMPGRPIRRARCGLCGEYVQDGREVLREGQVMCRPCSAVIYRGKREVSSPCVMRISHNGLEIRSKIWIERDGEPVFGRGRIFLLRGIEKYGSINQAAKMINISYRKAWSFIKAMEERLEMRLVERRSGGRNGGGAGLTRDAKIFLERYESLESGIRDIVDEKFAMIFKGGSDV